MFKLMGRSVLAIGFTVSAFLLMSYLITPDGIPPEPGDEETQISITRKNRPEESNQRQQELPPPPQSQKSPPPLMAMAVPKTRLGNESLSFPNPNLKSSTELGIGLNSNRRAIPMVTIPPEYPQGPLTRDIEGWVLLEFTISGDGSVDDITVVDAEPKGSFESAAIRAMKRWKYQPKIIDGHAVAQHHMQEIFRFEITK